MGFWSWIAKRSSAAAARISSLWGRNEVSAPIKTTKYLEEYLDDPIIYASVWTIATSAGLVRPRLFTQSGEEITDHPVLRLLNSPNPEQSYFDFIEATFIYLELAGEVYWEKSRGKLNLPTELWVLRPDRIRYRFSESKLQVYIYRVGNEEIVFDPADIVKVTYFNPTDDWRGLSPIRPLVDNIIDTSYAEKMRRRTFKRYGVAEGFLSTEQVINEAEMRRIRQSASSPGGSDPDRDVVVLPKGLQWQNLSRSARDLEFVRLIEALRGEKIAVLGVPPVLLGIVESARYANYDLQVRAFYFETLRPKLEKLAGAINRQLLSEYNDGEKLHVKFDLSQSHFADLSRFVETASSLYDMGALTPNEIIRLTGLGKEFEGGDTHLTPRSRWPVGETGPKQKESPGENQEGTS